MFICNSCLTFFETPALRDDSFEHAFGLEKLYSPCCPCCYSSDFEEATPCGNSSDNCNYMRKGEIICSECRAALFSRTSAFLQGLTPEEQRQLERWAEDFTTADFLKRD